MEITCKKLFLKDTLELFLNLWWKKCCLHQSNCGNSINIWHAACNYITHIVTIHWDGKHIFYLYFFILIIYKLLSIIGLNIVWKNIFFTSIHYYMICGRCSLGYGHEKKKKKEKDFALEWNFIHISYMMK